jgi:hypothetical protein
MDNPTRRYRLSTMLLAIFALALALRIGYAVLNYTPDLARFQSGDYTLYRIGADEFAMHLDFSNSIFLVRPPLFSLLIFGLIHILNGSDTTVMVVNILFGALIAPVTFALVWHLLPDRNYRPETALLAALLLAIDPSSIAYSSYMAPEPLANLTLIVSVTALFAAVRYAQSGTHRSAIQWAIVAGVALVMSMYSRPAAYLLWVALVVVLLAAFRHQLRAMLRVLIPYALISLLGVMLWTTHNGAVFGNPTFSTAGPYTLLYYRLASVERLATNQPIDAVYIDINRQIETRLGHTDLSKIDAGWQDHYLAATVPVQDAMTAVALEIIKAHPLLYIETLPIGFYRMFAYTQVFPLWTNVLEVPWNFAMLTAALVGLWLAIRRRDWLLLIGIGLVGLYFTAGVLAVKSAGMDTRERSMLSPFLAVAAAYALWTLLGRLRKTSNANVADHTSRPS